MASRKYRIYDAWTLGKIKEGVRFTDCNGYVESVMPERSFSGKIIEVYPHLNQFKVLRDDAGSWHINVENDRFDTISFEEEDVKSTNKKSFFMSIISKYRANRMPEPDKTLVKRGLMNEDGSPTEAGQELLIQALFDEKKEDLKKMVDSIPVEEDKEE